MNKIICMCVFALAVLTGCSSFRAALDQYKPVEMTPAMLAGLNQEQREAVTLYVSSLAEDLKNLKLPARISLAQFRREIIAMENLPVQYTWNDIAHHSELSRLFSEKKREYFSRVMFTDPNRTWDEILNCFESYRLGPVDMHSRQIAQK